MLIPGWEVILGNVVAVDIAFFLRSID
jgi:hypothetical protein